MDAFHRIVTGQALTPRQLTLGGILVGAWMLMDSIQFSDMVVRWFL